MGVVVVVAFVECLVDPFLQVVHNFKVGEKNV